MTESLSLIGIQSSWKSQTPIGYVGKADIRPVHTGTAMWKHWNTSVPLDKKLILQHP